MHLFKIWIQFTISSINSSNEPSVASLKENETFIHRLSILTKKNKATNTLSASTILLAIEEKMCVNFGKRTSIIIFFTIFSDTTANILNYIAL